VQQEKAELTNLSMREVQDTVKLRPGATVSLSACNTGRGEIKAEGVVGLARAFLVAGAAATVVSLWSVDDGSTSALMGHMYTHLVKGLTVPQALRLAMLRLAGCPVPELQLGVQEQDEHKDVAAGLKPAWKRPMHWAGFLVVGATTRLPRGKPRRAFAEWSVEEVSELVRGIGFTDAARVLAENGVDGKTLCSPDFDCLLTMDVSEGGLGLKPMQKARLKREMEAAGAGSFQ
jgi:hypothetical protein